MTLALIITLAAVALAAIGASVYDRVLYARARDDAAKAHADADSARAAKDLAALVAKQTADSLRQQLAAANDATLRAQAETRAVEADCGRLRAALAAKETPAERSDRMGAGP